MIETHVKLRAGKILSWELSPRADILEDADEIITEE